MSGIRKILFCLIALIAGGCAPGYEGRQHLPTVGRVGVFPYGGWVEAELKDSIDLYPSGRVSGELITIQDHKMYILDAKSIHIINTAAIDRARLFMYRKQPGVFAIVTQIAVIPNIVAAIAYPEYAAQFMAMAILPVVLGTTFTITEAGVPRNQLIYPNKNTFSDFTKFARFPQGLPTGLDFNLLKMKRYGIKP